MNELRKAKNYRKMYQSIRVIYHGNSWEAFYLISWETTPGKNGGVDNDCLIYNQNGINKQETAVHI